MTASLSKIIADVKRRSGIPANQDRFSTADFAALIEDQLTEDVYPQMIALREEFFLTNEFVTLTDTQERVPLPKRAYARSLREVKYISETGETYNIPQISLEDREVFLQSRSGQVGVPQGFVVFSDWIDLLGRPRKGRIQMTYVVSHPDIVTGTDTLFAAVRHMVFSGGTTSFEVNIENDIGFYCPNGATRLFDLYRKDTGALLYVNLPLTRSASGTYTTTLFSKVETDQIRAFQSGGLPSSGTVEMPYTFDLYFIPAGQTTFTVLPKEGDKILVASVVGRVMESLGHYEDVEANERIKSRLEKNVQNTMGDRIEGESKKAIARTALHAYTRRGK